MFSFQTPSSSMISGATAPGSLGLSNPGRVETYAGGQNPIVNLQEVSKKHFEFDFQLKRLNTVATNLREEFKAVDKKLNNLET